MDKLNESDVVVKLLVWCIASMNSFGVIRPLIFSASNDNAFELTPIFALKIKHEQILYYITWPIKVDSKKIYIFHDQSKIKEIEIAKLWGKSRRQILNKIPDWVYQLVKLK
jgi:hypothetical protein